MLLVKVMEEGNSCRTELTRNIGNLEEQRGRIFIDKNQGHDIQTKMNRIDFRPVNIPGTVLFHDLTPADVFQPCKFCWSHTVILTLSEKILLLLSAKYVPYLSLLIRDEPPV